MSIKPRAVFIFWLQYFLSEPNTLSEDTALSLKNTSALILYFSSMLVWTKNWSLSTFGNCFVNCSHTFFFAKASLAFVSGFRNHLSKALGYSAILDRVIFVQYKMVVLTIVTQKNGDTKGRRRRGRPKTTWRRTVESEWRRLGFTVL